MKRPREVDAEVELSSPQKALYDAVIARLPNAGEHKKLRQIEASLPDFMTNIQDDDAEYLRGSPGPRPHPRPP